jgi:ribonuclease HII
MATGGSAKKAGRNPGRKFDVEKFGKGPPTLQHEAELREQGHAVVAGIDEAGRGPLAGPVSAAAVVLPDGFTLEGLNDSKKLSPKRRELLFEDLTTRDDVVWAVAVIDAEGIDRVNILRASHIAMARAFADLDPPADAALIDGLPVPVRDFPSPQMALVKGDSRSLSIAAASIIAKVWRDRMMIEFDREFPEYGFQSHKGYGTKQHLAALESHGPCPIHRRSFRPVAQLSLEFGES